MYRGGPLGGQAAAARAALKGLTARAGRPVRAASWDVPVSAARLASPSVTPRSPTDTDRSELAGRRLALRVRRQPRRRPRCQPHRSLSRRWQSGAARRETRRRL